MTRDLGGNRSRRGFAALAMVSGAVAIVLSLTGCAFLAWLVGYCGLCLPPPPLASVPPRDNPLARALERPVDSDKIEAHLTAAAEKQYDEMGRRWPEPVDCSALAAPGCRYTLTLRNPYNVGRVSPGPDGKVVSVPLCVTRPYIVDRRWSGAPRVRANGPEASVACPPDGPDGASPASGP